MRAHAKWTLSLSALLLFTVASRAQEAVPDTTAGAVVMRGPDGPGFGGPFVERMELLGFGDFHGGKVVTGAPFSAVALGETKQTLADGTTISRKFQSNVYRDGEGRFRKEVTLPALGPLAASGRPHSFIIIQDPVAGGGYILEPDEKVAHKLPPRKGGKGEKGGPGGGLGLQKFTADSDGNMKYQKFSSDSDADVKKDSLGTQTINGVSAQGTRYTRTIPMGEIGNDRALTITKEEWYSPDLQIVVQSKHSDPFLGDTTYTVTNIQRPAPNARLFTVPADYAVKDGPPAGMPGGRRRGNHAPGEAPPAPGASAPAVSFRALPKRFSPPLTTPSFSSV